MVIYRYIILNSFLGRWSFGIVDIHFFKAFISALCSAFVPVEEFCTGPGQNILENDELLVSLSFPKPESNFGSRTK